MMYTYMEYKPNNNLQFKYYSIIRIVYCYIFRIRKDINCMKKTSKM